MNIFISGSVGSGKSTFAKYLMKYLDLNGFQLLDLDFEAKKIIKEKNILFNRSKNELFNNQQELFYIEKKVWENFSFPDTEKTLIVDASTFFECPKLFNSNDIIIYIDSNKNHQNVLLRDGEDRASLIEKNQLSKDLKRVCSDYVVDNNDGLLELEKKAKFFAENIQYQRTEEFKKEIDFIKKEWNKNFPDLPHKIVLKLIKEYTRIDRFYHNQSHLVYLLEKFNLFCRDKIKSSLWKRAVILAIFYHDVKMKFSIGTKNEEESVKFLFDSFREENLLGSSTIGPRSYVTLAADLILLTKTHNLNGFITESDLGVEYSKIFLDLDMLILSDCDNFSDYENGIRKEWMNFSDFNYVLGRVKVLKEILNKPIYQSDMFKERNNIAIDLIKENILKLSKI